METWRQKVERKTAEERERRRLAALELPQAEKEAAAILTKTMFVEEEEEEEVLLVEPAETETQVGVKAGRSISSASSPNADPLAKVNDLQENVNPPASGYAGLVSAKKRKKASDDESRFTENMSLEGIETGIPNGDSNGVEDEEQALPSGHAPIRKKPREKKEVKYLKRGVVEIRPNGIRPTWYASVGRPPKRTHVLDVQAVNRMIQRCISAGEIGDDSTKDINELRDCIHKVEFWPWLTQRIVMDSKVLEAKGLQRIFTEPHQKRFPYDIKADALALYTRWYTGDVTPELLRGVQIEKGVLASGQNRRSYSLKKEYADRKTSNVVGSNGLVNGQWWPIRICAIRDGAHGEQEAGISGKTGHGAYSVVVAHGGYDDIDRGETIEYCGTENDRPTPTKNTQLMLDSLHKNIPVRVMRSRNKKNKYAPKDGLRYDGLYDIVDHEILSVKTAMYRFSLRRQGGQDPIRYEGPEARPTVYEIQEKDSIQHLVSNTQI